MTVATSKMERTVIIVNDLKALTIFTKRSILDVAAALDPPLHLLNEIFISSPFFKIYVDPRNLFVDTYFINFVQNHFFCSSDIKFI